MTFISLPVVNVDFNNRTAKGVIGTAVMALNPGSHVYMRDTNGELIGLGTAVEQVGSRDTHAIWRFDDICVGDMPPAPFSPPPAA